MFSFSFRPLAFVFTKTKLKEKTVKTFFNPLVILRYVVWCYVFCAIQCTYVYCLRAKKEEDPSSMTLKTAFWNGFLTSSGLSTTYILDTIQDFLCKMGMKPCMQLEKIIIFSLYHVIVRPTKIIKDLCKAST